MTRVFLDLTDDEHKRLNELAAHEGNALEQYLLKSALPEKDDEQSLQQLETFLDERLRLANAGRTSQRSVGEIFEQAYRAAHGPS